MQAAVLGPLNGYPFRVGSIKLSPWIKDWRLFLRLEVLDAAFGNPPGFPFEDFVSAKRLVPRFPPFPLSQPTLTSVRSRSFSH
jgi:hypothetical protein